MEDRKYFIGAAGWNIASRYKDQFPQSGFHIERYAGRLHAVEINSSFYRPHRRETYEGWATLVPADFRFSVKMPRTITHQRRLADCDSLLDEFLEQVEGLGDKLGVLLLQLPPSLRFAPETAKNFFDALRRKAVAKIACEPRHESWFGVGADTLLASFRIARVAADPAKFQGAGRPGGWPGLAYFRLHGSPRVYYSDYTAQQLHDIRQQLAALREAGAEVWCIFDNTAEGNALGNAMALDDRWKKPAR